MLRVELKEGVSFHHLDEDGGRPLALFLPQAYEPRYPYPLLVFLHGRGADEHQWLNALPDLSRRNYVGLGLRGPRPVHLGPSGQTESFGWGRHRPGDAEVEDYVLGAIRETMRASHVHSERIYLAGFCEGAAVALQLALTFPDKFAGAIALNGWLPEGPFSNDLAAIRRMNFFLGHGLANERVPLRRAKEAADFLYAAGAKVALEPYESGHDLAGDMLRDVNRWLISRCEDDRLE
jgi:phospholipase/carboxylesterase